MSKYEEFQQRFVADGDFHSQQVDRCLSAVDDLTRQLIAESGWYPDDVEYISLGQPVTRTKPARILRFKRTGKNLDRIRDVANCVGSTWSLGIRLRLRPHVSVSFEPREVMFVLPLLIQFNEENEVVFQIEPEGDIYAAGDPTSLVELTFDRIEQILDYGIQSLTSKSHRADELQEFGFLLDSETLEELGVATDSRSRPALQPA